MIGIPRSDPTALVAAAWGSAASEIESLASDFEASPRTQPQRTWVLAAVLEEGIPTPSAFGRISTLVREEGVTRVLKRAVSTGSRTGRVEPVEDAVLLDVHHTVGTAMTSGIQRVVRETARRWIDRPGVVPVAWTETGTNLRRLTEAERAALMGNPADRLDGGAENTDALLPVSGAFIALELVSDTWRAERIQGLGAHPMMRSGAVGYDAVPLTSPETSSAGVVRQFPYYLDALAELDAVAAISAAARTEFIGWSRMLSASAARSPRISAVPLAAEISEPTAAEVDEARRVLGATNTEPVIVVVGSHEPRKNHLAVLQAARILWSEGRRFRLVFIGANSWGSERFHRESTELARAYPVVVVSKASDALLRGAYKAARFSVFPSLHEGFGLPVAESLALSTPVITSNYGSMAEIANAGGGALLIDPRDDRDLTAAMRQLLTDDLVLESLREAAAARPRRTWDQYADDLWDELIARPG